MRRSLLVIHHFSRTADLKCAVTLLHNGTSAHCSYIIIGMNLIPITSQLLATPSLRQRHPLKFPNGTPTPANDHR